MSEARPTLAFFDIDLTLLSGQWEEERQYRPAADIALAALHQDIRRARQEQPQRHLFAGTATGRTIASHSILERENEIFEAFMQDMDYKITSVGSEIWLKDESDLFVPASASEWPAAHNWDIKGVNKIISDLSSVNAAPQSESSRSTYKYSYEVNSSQEVKTIAAALHKAGKKVTLIYSQGKYLDILPMQADGSEVHKGSGVLHVAHLKTQQHNLKDALLLVAGDSENDLPMFRAVVALGGVCIVPANAKREFIEEIEDTIDEQQRHIATLPYADGVRQGMHRFKVLED